MRRKKCGDLPSPRVPIKQSMPSQETGTKLARALPYKFEIIDTVSLTMDKSITLSMKNLALWVGLFQVFDYASCTVSNPWMRRKNSIEPNKQWMSVTMAGKMVTTMRVLICNCTVQTLVI